MFMRKPIALSIIAIVWSSIAFANNELISLPNYTPAKAIPQFSAKLSSDTSFFTFFKNHPAILAQVLDIPSLQEKLVQGTITPQSLVKSTVEASIAPQVIKQNQVSIDSIKDLEKDVAKELADTAREPIRPSTPIIVTRPPVETPAPTRIDMNNVPQDVALDAKGWPKYLNVPTNCPAPQGGKKYIHEFHIGDSQSTGVDFGPSAPGNSWWGKLGFIRTFFSAAYTSAYAINSTDKEVFAVPFYTGYPGGNVTDSARSGITSSYLNVSWAPPGQYQGAHSLVISECPGDFSNVISGVDQPQGYGNLTAGITPDVTVAKAKVPTGNFLEPGKRYFLNMRGSGDCSAQVAANEAQQLLENPGQPVVQSLRRDGEAVCANVAESYTADLYPQYPPYTGQCRPNGPYPVGYNSFTCQENLYRQPCTASDSVHYRCFDALGIEAEVRYEQKCVGGHMTWSQGGNKPAYQNYVCVSTSVGGNTNAAYLQTHEWDAMPVYRVCAKHSEGFTRSLVVMQQNPVRQLAKSTDTCQFDSGKGYFYWKNTQRDTTFDAEPGGASWMPHSGDNKTHTTSYYNADGVLLEQKTN